MTLILTWVDSTLKTAIPTRNTNLDTGVDLYTSGIYNLSDSDNKPTMVGTNIKIMKVIPNRRVDIQLRARSSMAKKNLILMNGVGTIDSGYRGEIKAMFRCLRGGYDIDDGDRVIQIVYDGDVQFFDGIKYISLDGKGNRGAGGFGSSGK